MLLLVRRHQQPSRGRAKSNKNRQFHSPHPRIQTFILYYFIAIVEASSVRSSTPTATLECVCEDLHKRLGEEEGEEQREKKEAT
jgi:hypothetical protein